jgi:hypothetical protein
MPCCEIMLTLIPRNLTILTDREEDNWDSVRRSCESWKVRNKPSWCRMLCENQNVRIQVERLQKM